MNQIKEIKKEYLEKFDGLIGDVQENKTDKFVIDLVWSFIESSLLAYRKEVEAEFDNRLREVIKKHGAILLDGKMYALKHLTKMVVVNTGETIKIDKPITLPKDTRKKKE